MGEGFLKAASGARPGSGEDLRGLDEAYRRYRGEVSAYIERKFGRGPPEPDDVAQTAFLRFASYARDNPIENPRAFLYTLARNIVLDHRRRAQVAEAHARELKPSLADAPYEFSPERVLLDRERLGLLVEALTQMPLRRRRMVLMNRFENLSCEEIGRRLGVSTSTVQKEVVRGLAECLDHLSAAAGESDEDGAG
jgi:RNA polymerase sigma-70 factor (ECF subfamily)